MTGHLTSYETRTDHELATRHALQLDPFDPMHFSTLASLACGLICLGEDAEAIRAVTRAVSKNPEFAWAWRVLAAALALAGRVDEGRGALATLLRLDPDFTIGSISKRSASADRAFRRMIEGLRLLEAPEG
jgi:adenylate cyclase